MKCIGALAIMLKTVFMALVGIHSDVDKSSFAKNNPWFYDNLSMFGLKISHYDGEVKLTHKQMLENMKYNLYNIASYLIMSILIY